MDLILNVFIGKSKRNADKVNLGILLFIDENSLNQIYI